MVNIAFPGLGIEPFTVNPVAFTIPLFGGLEVRWYGLIITTGIILAFLYCAFRAKQEGIVFDDVLDIALFTVIFAIIGARAYYVLTSLEKYDSFYEMIAIWEGGIAIYGAVIAGAITIWAVCRYKKLSALKMLDATAPAVMIGQILGRWGNFFNGEAHGPVVTEGSLFYSLRMGLYPHDIEGVRGMAYVHPTFLYESVWNLVGFVLIHFLYQKKKFDGQVVLMYITWYGFGRMLIEGLRTDSLYVGVFRISQVVGFLCFAIGAILLTVNLIKARRLRLNDEQYAPAYPSMPSEASAAANTEIKATESNTAKKDPTESPVQESQSDQNEFIFERQKDAESRFQHLFGEDNNKKQNNE